MSLTDTPSNMIIKIPTGRGLFVHELQKKYPEFAWTYEPGFGEWEIQLGTYWCLIYKTRVVVKSTLWGDFWSEAGAFIRRTIKSRPKNVCTETSLVSLITCRCFREYDVLIRDTKNCRTPPPGPPYFTNCIQKGSQCRDHF